MPRLNMREGKKDPLYLRFWKFLNRSLFRLNLLVTFLGILPMVLFIYYNIINFNAIRVLVGCIVLLTLIHANKSIQ